MVAENPNAPEGRGPDGGMTLVTSGKVQFGGVIQKIEMRFDNDNDARERIDGANGRGRGS